MKSPPTNCPRCEALNPFRPQRRSIGDNFIEIFIRCPTCHWERVLDISTPEIERLRRLRHRWQAYGRGTTIKHGVRSSLAERQIGRIQRRLKELQNGIE